MSKIEQHFINKAVDHRKLLNDCKWYEFKKKYFLKKEIKSCIKLAMIFSKKHSM